jgi:hypothetical protein
MLNRTNRVWLVVLPVAILVLILALRPHHGANSTTLIVSPENSAPRLAAPADPSSRLLKFTSHSGVKDMRPFCQYIVHWTSAGHPAGNRDFIRVTVKNSPLNGKNGQEVDVEAINGATLSYVELAPWSNKPDVLQVFNDDGSITQFTHDKVTAVTACATDQGSAADPGVDA